MGDARAGRERFTLGILSGDGATEDEELATLREFVVRLGSAMTVAGDSVDSINDRLRRVVDAYGSPGFEFFVLG